MMALYLLILKPVYMAQKRLVTKLLFSKNSNKNAG